tara:strand:- start:504 stop:677 length:174 start_codon:yes stop_codon:yes gene_type:complete
MSKLVDNIKSSKVSLNVKETDFLLKLLLKSTFQGAEIEVAYETIKKLTEMHRVKLES